MKRITAILTLVFLLGLLAIGGKKEKAGSDAQAVSVRYWTVQLLGDAKKVSP